MPIANFNIFSKIAKRGLQKNLGDLINISAAVSTPIGLAGFVIPDAATRIQRRNLEKQEMLAEKLQRDPMLKKALANSASPQILKSAEVIPPPPFPPNSLSYKREYIYTKNNQ